MQMPSQNNDPIGDIPAELLSAGLKANQIVYLAMHAIDQLFGQNYAMKNPALLATAIGIVERAQGGKS